MMNMELTFTKQAEEAEIKRRWKKVFFALYAPMYVRYALYVVLFCLCGFLLRLDFNFIFFALALGYFLAILSWYSRTWKIYHEVFRKTGQFEKPTTVHLTDTFMELTGGENSAKNVYSIFSGYIELKDEIALINQKTIAATFRKKYFSDGGEELMQCLDKAGVKKIDFGGFRRWRLVLLPIAMMVILGIIHFSDVRFRNWIHEKSYNTKCLSNLKMLMCDLIIYSEEQKEAGNIAFAQSETLLEELVEEGYVNEKNVGCPKLSLCFIYVPYKRPLDSTSSTAANTPVLFDWIIGAHKKAPRLLGKTTTQTMVAFEDGHVSAEENLRCHKDIYERYAPFMSKEDAEVLRKCCEEHDNMCIIPE